MKSSYMCLYVLSSVVHYWMMQKSSQVQLFLMVALAGASAPGPPQCQHSSLIKMNKEDLWHSSAAGLNTHSVQCPHHQLSDDDFQTVLAGRLFCYYIPQLAAGRPLHSLYYCSWILYGFFWWLFDCHCYHRIWVCSSWNLAMVDK